MTNKLLEAAKDHRTVVDFIAVDESGVHVIENLKHYCFGHTMSKDVWWTEEVIAAVRAELVTLDERSNVMVALVTEEDENGVATTRVASVLARALSKEDEWARLTSIYGGGSVTTYKFRADVLNFGECLITNTRFGSDDKYSPHAIYPDTVRSFYKANDPGYGGRREVTVEIALYEFEGKATEIVWAIDHFDLNLDAPLTQSEIDEIDEHGIEWKTDVSFKVDTVTGKPTIVSIEGTRHGHGLHDSYIFNSEIKELIESSAMQYTLPIKGSYEIVLRRYKGNTYTAINDMTIKEIGGTPDADDLDEPRNSTRDTPA